MTSHHKQNRRFRLAAAIDSLEGRTLFATVPAGFTENLVGASIANGTAMAFAPDGRLFVAQQTGQLRVVDHGALQATPFTTVPTYATITGERGLLGVAFDPNYFDNHYVYVYYTALTPAAHNRVSRFTADPNNQDVALTGSETVLLDLNNLSSATNHNGGAIHFGNDGKLYIGVGENANGANAQSFGNLLGKMLRMNKDGSIPIDNPYVNDANVTGQNKLIWSLGLRNPFTFAVQRTSGRIFIDDVGENTFEEINDGIAHSNYGWNTIEGFRTTQTAPPDYRDPLFVYNHTQFPSAAIIGGAFYNPTYNTYGASYDGKYFFGDLNNSFIKTFDPATATATNFATGTSALSGIDIGPDGSIYYIQRGGTAGVYRIRANDTVAPNASSSVFVFNEAKPAFGTSQRLRVTFNEYVGDSLTPSDVVITNQTTGAVIPTANITIQYDTSTNIATFNFPGYADANGALPNGNYHVAIAAAGVTDVSGNLLAAPVSFDFFALAGDVNRDRRVNGSDQSTLTANLGGPNRTYAQGDLNYDGTIDSFDQSILNTNLAYALNAPGTTFSVASTAGNDAYAVKLETPNVIDLYSGSTATGSPFARVYVGTGAASSINFDGFAGNDAITFVGTSAAESFAFSPSGTVIGPAPILYSNIEAINLDAGGGFDNVSVTPGAVVNLVGTQQLNSLTISGTANAAPAADPVVAHTLSITGTGKLDLNTSDLLVNSTAKSVIEGYVKTAYNFGGWNGASGIFSNAAKNNPQGNTMLGVMSGSEYANNSGATSFDSQGVIANDVLVKYTYFGDVDFNGAVDGTDYNLIDFGFLTHASGWANGDVDYSGAIDSTDYNLIDFAFVSQSGVL